MKIEKFEDIVVWQETSISLRRSEVSCDEVQSHLYVALDQKYIAEEKFKDVFKLRNWFYQFRSQSFGLVGKCFAFSHCEAPCFNAG